MINLQLYRYCLMNLTHEEACNKLEELMQSVDSFVYEHGYESHWQCKLEEIGFTFDADGEVVPVLKEEDKP